MNNDEFRTQKWWIWTTIAIAIICIFAIKSAIIYIRLIRNKQKNDTQQYKFQKEISANPRFSKLLDCEKHHFL